MAVGGRLIDPIVDLPCGQAEAAGNSPKAEILAGNFEFISIADNRITGVGIYH
jgi:hypothetical protein